MSKDTAFNGETTPRHTILCNDSQCLPPGDPKILCTKHEYPITGKSFIPAWKLSRQIATIYLQTTHCQILVLFFLHGIPQKTTLLDFKSSTVLKTALIVVVFRMWAVYDTGTSTHSPSQQKWIPAASLITKNKVGHLVQFKLIIRSR